MSIPGVSALDWLALLWFAACWIGYNQFSQRRSKRRDRLQDALHRHCQRWVRVLQKREVRIVDTAAISNIERPAAFLASSSLLIIAGLLTAAGSSDQAVTFLSKLPFLQSVSHEAWELGMLLLVLIYAYAFFTFTWCMRQWGFASILVGSAPLFDDAGVSQAERDKHGQSLSEVVWYAITSFNRGLRAYYFSLALLTWFVHPVAFMLASAWVVAVLYRREFRSRTLDALLAGLG
ncbi:MAG: DUF599 family protein [Chromatiales bacterium]|nr:DUF599 family protein [Chromatiales bacterium]